MSLKRSLVHDFASGPIAPARAASGLPLAGKQLVLTGLIRQGMVPVFVNDQMDSRRLVEAAVGAGCRVLEYTCRRADAREMIPWIKREYPGVAVLAATLLDGPRIGAHLKRIVPGFITVDEAADLGADGLVSFLRFQPETYARYGSSLVMVAGVGSANEALDQLELGADLIKVTVGSASGSDLVTKSRVPTHGCIPYFISGGLTHENVESYIKAGVVVTAAGFDLLLGHAHPSEAELPRAVQEAVTRMRATIETAREKHQPGLAEAITANATNLLAAGPWYHAGVAT